MKGIKIIVVNLILHFDSFICEEIHANYSLTDNVEFTKGNYVPKQMADKLTTKTDWIAKLIDRHNVLRQRHNSPRLKFNYTLCLISQAWADHLASTKSWGHNHVVLNKYHLGENIARFSQIGVIKPVNASTSVDLWYNEIKDYNYKTGQANSYGRPVGHFTQLVWRSTLEIGAAMAIRKENNKNFVYVVANYYEQGNRIGKHVQNVLPPTRKRPKN